MRGCDTGGLNLQFALGAEDEGGFEVVEGEFEAREVFVRVLEAFDARMQHREPVLPVFQLPQAIMSC